MDNSERTDDHRDSMRFMFEKNIKEVAHQENITESNMAIQGKSVHKDDFDEISEESKRKSGRMSLSNLE